MKKEAENIRNCEEIKVEIDSMWNVKTKRTPPKTGADRTISQSLRTYLEITAYRSYRKQKTAVLGKAHKLRKALM
jgi:hypothetical protein